MTATTSTIQDIKIAFNTGKTMLSTIEQLQGEWIYMVDPETMNEVKSIYRNSKENVSLYGVFCKLLKQ